ncbi:MAG TPA: deoxyguanosinetriphosphate triphosphohydrolase [Steroidobacteraceae bacterium]|jgi:dGTPase|nr:deoxyguanosinetriphosphate triphosphohydrolase [Steroidobacteraceae bacterium]
MDQALASYAALDELSRGRRFPEPPPRFRSEFQRDRDRIIHSNAFRRLVYKTQVFVNHEGDLYRTRITHSLEVAQIGRTVARALKLNETLTEAICLAHDLGHTPFGHAGQYALNECMREYGGFEHNLQSLRVVDELEERYADFSGLNLTFECREGVLKHCSPQNARLLGEVGERFLKRTQPGLEAQLANLADAIAYNNHDVDDGVRAGLITVEDLVDVRVFARFHSEVVDRYPGSPPRRQLYETIRRMVDYLVSDVIVQSEKSIIASKVDTIQAVRARSTPLISLSEDVLAQHQELKRFLRAKLYNHPKVREVMDEAGATLKSLFEAYMKDPSRLPPEHQSLVARAEAASGKAAAARVVADYVAGMTDRFAFLERSKVLAANV